MHQPDPISLLIRDIVRPSCRISFSSEGSLGPVHAEYLARPTPRWVGFVLLLLVYRTVYVYFDVKLVDLFWPIAIFIEFKPSNYPVASAPWLS